MGSLDKAGIARSIQRIDLAIPDSKGRSMKLLARRIRSIADPASDAVHLVETGYPETQHAHALAHVRLLLACRHPPPGVSFFEEWDTTS